MSKEDKKAYAQIGVFIGGIIALVAFPHIGSLIFGETGQTVGGVLGFFVWIFSWGAIFGNARS